MKVFIDFDDVILNTGEFVTELRAFFGSYGVDATLFQKHYYDCGSSADVKLFNPWSLIDRLESEEAMDVCKLRENFSMYIKNLSKFVFADVDSFLNFVGKDNVYLISFGLPAFQNEKIVACGISNMVKGCIVTSNSKASAIGIIMEKMKIDANEKVVFIDDRVEQVQDVKKVFPGAATFLLCRKEGRYCDQKNEYCDYEVHDLSEVKEIISKL